MLIMGKITYGLNVSACSAESIENFGNASSRLHGNDSQLIFLVDPDQECLSIIMENASTRWPISVKIACSQESISLFEKEMIINQLF